MGTPNDGGTRSAEPVKSGGAVAPAAPATAPAGVTGTGSVSASARGQSREIIEWGEGAPPAPNDGGAGSATAARPGGSADLEHPASPADAQGKPATEEVANPEHKAEAERAMAKVKAVAEAYQAKAQRVGAEPKNSDSEVAILQTFDALAPESQKAFLLGKPDAEGLALLKRIANLMQKKLAELNAMQKVDRGAATQKVKPAVPNMGQRDQKKQAKLFFDKVMSTGGRPGFWSEEPIYVDRKTKEVVDGPDKGQRLGRTAWRHPKHVGIRVDRALKYSAFPSISRHHWGTDIDVMSVHPEDWQAAGGGKPAGRFHKLGLWLESKRDVLPLKTTFSGQRQGGYLDEAWHLSMRELGPAMHERFNRLVSNDDLLAAILAAFDDWAQGAGGRPRGIEHEVTRRALDAKLRALTLSDYVDGVNPDMQPEGAGPEMRTGRTE